MKTTLRSSQEFRNLWNELPNHWKKVILLNLYYPDIYENYLDERLYYKRLYKGISAEFKEPNDLDSLKNIEKFFVMDFDDEDFSIIPTFLARLNWLKRVKLTKINISDITPLGSLIDLMELDLSWNYISDVTPLQNLTNLTKLCLNGNEISDIAPLQNLTNLTELQLEESKISDVTSLRNMTNLTKLRLGGIHIFDITPLQNLTNLTELSLISYRISDIAPLGNLTNLTVLNSSGNNKLV